MATHEIEVVVKNGVSFPELKNSYAKSWADIKAHLPKGFDPHYLNFVRGYFRAQLRIARGQKKKAAEIFSTLDKEPGFSEFEQKHGELLAEIDVLVRGTTARKSDKKIKF